MGKARDATRHAAKQKKQTRKERMLASPEVRRWHDNLARGSAVTADVRVRRLDKFCEIHCMTPMQLADLGMRDARTAASLIEDHVTMMEERGHAPGYVEDFVKAVKSWLAHFDVEIRRKIRVRDPNRTPTLEGERVPDAAEIAEVFARAPLRAAAMISLMAKAGLRPEVLGNHDGTDGLTMRDLPDIAVHMGEAKCVREPAQVVVRRGLSKAGHQYFTFLTSSGTARLLAYLNDRLARGEPLHGGSPVVAPDSVHRTNRGANAGKPFLPTRQVSREVRRALRPRFGWRPYVMRSYFDTELLVAESRGRIAHDFRVFFMGHRGTIESRYTTNKGVLPEILLGEMRGAFARSEEFLDLESARKNPAVEQRQSLHEAVSAASPEQLGPALEMLQRMGIGNSGAGRAGGARW